MAKSNTSFIWDLLQRQDAFSFSYEVAHSTKNKEKEKPKKEQPTN